MDMGAQAAVNGIPLAGLYCASKIAVHMLTKTIALENGNGITCNPILPSIIDTPANRRQMPDANHSNWVTPEKIAKTIEGFITSETNGELLHI